MARDAAGGVGGAEDGMKAALIHLGFALVAQAAPVSVGEVLSDPDRFDGQVVTIEGTMMDLRQRVTRFGNPYYKFYLSDGKLAILVTSFGRPPCRSGAVTVEGTFAKMKRGRLATSYNVVSASRVICRQTKSRDERDPADGVGGVQEGERGG